MSLMNMSLIQMSFSAAVMILAIIVVRALAINKLPKKVFVLLWDVVILRLLIPFSIPSAFSAYTFVKRSEPLRQAIAEVPIAGMITQEVTLPANSGVNVETVAQSTTPSSSPLLIIWIMGFILCAVFFAISYIRGHREFQTSIPVRNEFAVGWLRCHRLKRTIQIRQSDRISAPLTYGIVKPVILMPKKTDWENRQQLEYILLHEYTHICRLDMIIKLVATLALCLHWFNPFVWAMYILFNRDIELSCDESVVRQFGESAKAVYARTLITMEEKKSGLTPLYNSFSRNAIEERISAIMKTKKVTIGIIFVSAVIMITIIVMFATTAKVQSEQMVFVMGRVYSSTNEDVSEKVAGELAVSEWDSPFIGVIETTVEKDQIPAKELQSNFGCIGAQIVFSRSGIAVNIDGKWIQFNRSDDEPINNSSEDGVESMQEAETKGIIGDGIEETGTVLEMAKIVVGGKYADMQSTGYVNWRIDSLTEEYFYNFGGADAGVQVTVYQLGYALLAEDPDQVTLTRGMTIDEDGWVVPEYPGSTYLCLVADGGALSYVVLTENDCFPGDEVFTEDLKQVLGIPTTEEDYYNVATFSPASEVEQFALGVKNDILASDWKSLSEKILYPITISGIHVTDSAAFQKLDFDGMINQEFVNAIAAESCREMFCNWQGIMMGATGQVWIASVDNGAGQWELKVIELNGLMEEVSLERVMNRIAGQGLEQAIRYEKGYIGLQKDAVIRLCVSESGKFEAYGFISPEYGQRGILLNNIIDREGNWNYFDSDWGYGKQTPKIQETDSYEILFSYYREDGSWCELIFDTYETGTMSVREVYAD